MALVSTADPTIDALFELRRTRQRKRIATIHWVDALYHVYIAAIVSLVGTVLLAGAAGGVKLDAAGIADVLNHGPAVLGLFPAAAILIGLRSGSRGGPLALEQPDVRHVLMSAVPRSAALRSPVLRQLRFFCFLGIVIGGASGLFARHRFGSNPAALIGYGAGFGLASVLLGIGCALVAAGRRIPRWIATLLGLVVLVWSIGDVANRLPTAPTTFLGRMPLWPLRAAPLSLIPAAVGIILAVAGVLGISGLSIENAERRTRLVGQLRFAVTLQDLRTVLVLRRQLAQELPRSKPWIGSGRYRSHPRFSVWSRGWHSVLRFPASRLVRLVLIALVAGFAARGVWDGTLPLVVLAGLALWVGGLDAIEALAQETDHPTRTEGYPCDSGELMVRHLPVPTVVMVVLSVLIAAVFVAAGPSIDALKVAAIAILPMAAAGVAGAVISALMGAPDAASDSSVMLPPEFAGMKNGVRTAWPPGVAILGVMPIFAARLAVQKHVAPWQPEIIVAIAVVVVAGFVAAWVRFREDLHAWWKNAMAEAKQQQSARAKPTSSKTRTDDVDNEEHDVDEDVDDEDEYQDDEEVEYDAEYEDEK